MFVVVWQFEIAEEKVAAFESAYSSEGSWAQLFGTSPEYRGTELLRDAYISGQYLTIDRWDSEPTSSNIFRRLTGKSPAASSTTHRSRFNDPLACATLQPGVCVIAGRSASQYTRSVHLHLQRVVLVGAISGSGLKRQLVARPRVADCIVQLAGNVSTRNQDLSA